MPEPDESVLGATLRAIAAPASRPDVASLVVAGRRRDRWRRAATAGGVFIAVAAVTLLVTLVAVTRHAAPEPVTPPVPLTSCTAGPFTSTIAGGLNFASTAVVDPTLRYVAGGVVKGGTGPLAQGGYFVWDNGVAHAIPSPAPGFGPGEPFGVNSRGWTVSAGGTVSSGTGRNVPVLYRDGKSTLLPLPTGYDMGVAYGINTRGNAVGLATKGNDPTGVAVLWRAANPGSVVRLPTPRSAVGSVAMAVNDAGVIGGSLSMGQGRAIPYIWTSPSSGHALHVPGGFDGGEVWLMRGEHAAGFVSKFEDRGSLAGDVSIPAEWDLRTGAVHVAPEEFGGVFGALDASGRYVINQTRADSHPSFLIQPGGPTIELPGLPGVTGLYPEIHGMSNDGHQLVGILVHANGQPESGLMTWTCA